MPPRSYSFGLATSPIAQSKEPIVARHATSRLARQRPLERFIRKAVQELPRRAHCDQLPSNGWADTLDLLQTRTPFGGTCQASCKQQSNTHANIPNNWV